MPFTDEERAAVEPLQLVSGPFIGPPQAGLSIASRHTDGACVFYDAATRLCAVHRAAGQRALPLTCRMFPRIVRHDSIGTRLSLSHYCPTAAALLFVDNAVAVVEAVGSLVNVGELDGLDARDELPPLLRPGVLMDVESYREWESGGVHVLTTPARSAQEAIDRLAHITRDIVTWSPGEEPLLTRVQHAYAGLGSWELEVGSLRVSAVSRWLASRLFGNWIAYQGRGLETIVRYLQACLDAFTVELARDGDAVQAIRRADYLIVHESDSQELADRLS